MRTFKQLRKSITEKYEDIDSLRHAARAVNQA